MMTQFELFDRHTVCFAYRGRVIYAS